MKASMLEHYTMDDALYEVGGFSYFQYFIVIITLLGAASPANVIYPISFYTLHPTYWCEVSQNYYRECESQLLQDNPQVAYIVDWESETSIVNWVQQFNLLYVPAQAVGLIGLVYFAGWLLFSLFLPRLADLYGRKIVFQVSTLSHALALIGYQFTDSFTVALVLTFFMGAGISGCTFVGFLNMNEFIPKRYRSNVSSVAMAYFSLPLIIAVIYLKFVSRNVNFLVWLGFTEATISFFASFLFPESPLYLASSGQLQEAKNSLNHVARFNGRKHFEGELLTRTQAEKDSQSMSKSFIHEGADFEVFGKISELWNVPFFRNATLILSSVWITCSFNFYLIGFYLKFFDGDIYTNSLFAAISEVLGYLSPSIIMLFFTFKKSLMLCYMISLIGFIGYTLFSSTYPGTIPFMIFMAKFGMCANFTLAYYSSTLYYPPIISATAMSFCNFLARSLTAFASLVVETREPIPMLIASTLCVVSAIASTKLKETIPKWT